VIDHFDLVSSAGNGTPNAAGATMWPGQPIPVKTVF